MKCAMCGREIRGRDYIHVSTANEKEIYVHSVPCDWYEKINDNDVHRG